MFEIDKSGSDVVRGYLRLVGVTHTHTKKKQKNISYFQHTNIQNIIFRTYDKILVTKKYMDKC